MKVKTILNALEVVRENYAETSMRLQQVRDEILELEDNGRPVGISLEDKERALSDRKAQLGALINELMALKVH